MFRVTHVAQQRAGKTPPNLYRRNIDKMDPLLADLLEEVSDEFGTTPIALLSPRREQPLPAARVEFCRRAYALQCFSLPQIGRAINRDHTTVLFCLGRLKQKPSKTTERHHREHKA